MSIHNYLNILKNAIVRRETSVSFKRSNNAVVFVRFLNQNGFIRSFELSKKRITVFLKFDSFGNSSLNALWTVPHFKPAPLTSSKSQSLLRSFSVPISLSSLTKSLAHAQKVKSDNCLGILR